MLYIITAILGNKLIKPLYENIDNITIIKIITIKEIMFLIFLKIIFLIEVIKFIKHPFIAPKNKYCKAKNILENICNCNSLFLYLFENLLLILLKLLHPLFAQEKTF